MQAVEVRAPSSNRQHPYTFTFCLERIDVGPYKVRGSCTTCHHRTRSQASLPGTRSLLRL